MKLLVRQVQPDEVEQDVTQRDQFNTDEVGLGETLVREAHQNTMDGRSHMNDGPVRTRLRIVDSSDGNAGFWGPILEPLRPHLNRCGIDITGLDLARPRLLLIEDFGTTGLLGAVDHKDSRNFSDFWRRMGRSHKHGSHGGRWGLGKLVFSSASRIRTFFGLTIRDDDPARTAFLMGQAVLKNHDLNGASYAPHAFFGIPAENGLQLPVSDPELLQQFTEAASLSRTNEPGLSIVIPCVQSDITIEALMPHVIRNWFFPILTGHLVVEIGDHVIDAESFAALAREHGGTELQDGSMIEFIRDLKAASEAVPAVTLSPAADIFAGIDETRVCELREAYNQGSLISVRIPLVLRRKAGGIPLQTHVDAYLKSAPERPSGEAVFVRGALTLPGESRGFRGRSCFAALVAQQRDVVEFLGDAENPAHTRWTGTAEKVTQNWANPSARLREIRAILNVLYNRIVETGERLHEDALLDFFSIKNVGVEDQSKSKKPIIRKPKVPPIPPRPAAYRIQQRQGGFRVAGSDPDQIPFELRVRVAYDVARGDPLGRFSPYDFDFQKKEIHVEAEGANVQVVSANELRVEAVAEGFNVVVSGFDPERDLFLRADRQ